MKRSQWRQTGLPASWSRWVNQFAARTSGRPWPLAAQARRTPSHVVSKWEEAFIDSVPVRIPAPSLRKERCRGHSRSEEHTSELQSLMHISYAVFCLKKKKKKATQQQ